MSLSGVHVSFHISNLVCLSYFGHIETLNRLDWFTGLQALMYDLCDAEFLVSIACDYGFTMRSSESIQMIEYLFFFWSHN